ncbi:MAG TPA: COX15/CtaA family protein [Candidatus Competibacteraceae bacterium]|nr:COX15/CtaA family protein [Candidatus Competibacteraceae bacterium]
MILFRRLALAAVLLAFVVVVLGAWVRLSDAGLGCPDWPGCYGHLTVPSAPEHVENANAAYPERPLEAHKAWKEMIHRYCAGVLGLLVLALALLAWRRRGEPGQPLALPLALLALVVFQALLGMWTVTLQLKPLVVMAHLLGGLATLALLWWLNLGQQRWLPSAPADAGLRPWALLAFAAVVGQIALGGWTSANYAALACVDFPTCQAQWWPQMDFREAFVLWRGLGINYEYGVLEHPARVAIHVSHRLGALVVLLLVGWLAWRALRRGATPQVRRLGLVLALALALQLLLGVSNVLFALPLPVAVAHNGGAALLVLTLVTLNHILRARSEPCAPRP